MAKQFSKIDAMFSGEILSGRKSGISKHTKHVKMVKRLLPCIAAGLIGLLLIYPQLKKDVRELAIDITKPKAGEIEKLHVENTIFYITDKNNQVHNFTATNIDETEPGSKLVKIHDPEGILPMSPQTWFTIKAPEGYFNQTENVMTLNKMVEMFYSEGMNMEVPNLAYSFKENRGYSNDPVTATGYMGDLESQGLEFFSDKSIIIFKGKTNIKLKEESLKK